LRSSWIRKASSSSIALRPGSGAPLTLARQRGTRNLHGRRLMDEQLERMADFFSEALQ
jgi:shikimate dehydrogenase